MYIRNKYIQLGLVQPGAFQTSLISESNRGIKLSFIYENVLLVLHA